MDTVKIQEMVQPLKDISEVDVNHIRALATCIDELCNRVQQLEQEHLSSSSQ